MTDPIEQHLTLAAMYKFMNSEPMSPQDVNRILKVLDTSKLEVATADAPTIAGIRIQLKTILQNRYLQENKQAVA